MVITNEIVFFLIILNYMYHIVPPELHIVLSYMYNCQKHRNKCDNTENKLHVHYGLITGMHF